MSRTGCVATSEHDLYECVYDFWIYMKCCGTNPFCCIRFKMKSQNECKKVQKRALMPGPVARAPSAVRTSLKAWNEPNPRPVIKA